MKKKKMTPEERAEWAQFQREMALHELAMLDRIEYHSRKIREEGGTPVTSDEWVAIQRRRIEKALAAPEP